jgi:glycine cleavage system aminomethyltransferase T
MAAHAGSVTMGGVSEELATNRALAKVPQGKSVTDTTCEVIGTAGHSKTYRCTVTWD